MSNFLDDLDKKRSGVEPDYAAVSSVDRFIVDLVKLRKQQGLTQEDVAIRSGLKQPHISKIERLETERITFETILRYATALGAEFRLESDRKVS